MVEEAADDVACEVAGESEPYQPAQLAPWHVSSTVSGAGVPPTLDVKECWP